MKRVLLGLGMLALAGLVGSTANAADLSRRYEAPITKAPAYVPVYSWTGPYLGINGGGGWGTSRWDSTGSFDVSGGLFGVQAGYNWQMGQAVFGVEGDIDWTNIKGSTTAFCALGCETSNSWLATIRGRLGYAIDRFMPYVTGGAAFGNVRARTPGFAGGSDTGTGWTLGGGVEFAIAPNWTVKGEYLYVDLGNFNCGLACGGGLAVDNVDFKSHIVRAGLNYRF